MGCEYSEIKKFFRNRVLENRDIGNGKHAFCHEIISDWDIREFVDTQANTNTTVPTDFIKRVGSLAYRSRGQLKMKELLEKRDVYGNEAYGDLTPASEGKISFITFKSWRC